MRYFEDLEIGDGDTFGAATLTEDDIIGFAEQYDPQPIHTDPEAAADSMFGGLLASGWHTAAVTMRLLVKHFFSDTAFRGSIGIDELRWSAPVRPGDTLSVENEVLDKEPYSDSLGLVRGYVSVTNQDDEEVMTMTGLLLFARRPAVDGEE